MNDNLDQFDAVEQPAKLPVFLKVLCILTFVGSGMGVLGALMSLMMGRFSERVMTNANEFTDGMYDRMGINIDEMIRWSAYSNYANLLGSAMCLTGALLMWKLKKTGYFLYVPGAIIPAVVGVIASQYIMGGGIFAGIGVAGSVIGVVVAIAFIAMYGANYKHLR